MPDDVYGIDLEEGSGIAIVKSIISGDRGDLASYLISALGGGGSDQPACSAGQGAGQAVAAGTWTNVLLPTEVYDSDGMHDTVTNNHRFTAVTAGAYLFVGAACWNVGNMAVATRFTKNGSVFSNFVALQISSAGLNGQGAFNSIVFPLAVGDWVALQGYCSSANTLNGSSAMTCVRIGS